MIRWMIISIGKEHRWNVTHLSWLRGFIGITRVTIKRRKHRNFQSKICVQRPRISMLFKEIAKRSDCNEGKMLNTTGGSSRMHVNTQIQLSLVCKTSRFRTLTGAWFTKQFLSLMSRDDAVRSLHDRSTGQPRRGHRTLFSSSRPQSQKGRPCRDIP